jgi:cell division protein FtsB
VEMLRSTMERAREAYEEFTLQNASQRAALAEQRAKNETLRAENKALRAENEAKRA